MDKRPIVGFYDLAGCNGCLLSVLFNEDELLDLTKLVDIRTFRFIKEIKEEKQFDMVFVEGLVACNNDLDVLKALRARSKTLVALGACACTGCIPAMRNFIDQSRYAYLVYERAGEIKDQPPTPISNHVQVDYSIPGCPPSKRQIAAFIKDVALGKKPYDYDRPVCFECRLNENRCLLDDGKMCLGPMTRGGCDSVCTNAKFECWGCRGPMPDANPQLMAKLLEQKGYSKEQVRQRMRTFSGMLLEKPELKVAKPLPKRTAKRIRKKGKSQKNKKAARKKSAVKKKSKPHKETIKRLASQAKKARRPVKSKPRKPKATKQAAAKHGKKQARKPGIIGMIKKKLKKK
jgi:sulfhydrogenase subunit delta